MGVIMHKNVSYGGGSVVEPNPQESATEQLETLGIDGDVYEVTDADYRNTDHTFTMNTYSSYSHTFEDTQISQKMPVRNVFTGIQSLFNSVKTAINDHGSLFGDIATALTNKVSKDEATYKSLSYSSITHEIDDSEELTTQFDGAGEMGSVWFANMNLGIVTDAVNDHAEWIAKETAGSKTVTGNPITITDAAGIKAEKIEIGFEPQQDKHGYNSVWVGGAGKNKLPIKDTIATTTLNGVTFTVEKDIDGNVVSIDVDSNGSAATGLANFELTNFTTVKNGTILSGCPSGGNYSSSYSLAIVNNSYSSVFIDQGSGVNITSDTTGCKVVIFVRSGYTISHKKFYPMIRESGQTATYEPPSNISPITGYTSIGADRCGKNLWGYGNVTFTGYNKDVEITRKLTGSFSMSLTVTSNDTDASTCAMIIYYKSGSASAIYQWARGSRQAKTFNIGDNVVDKIRFYSSDNYNHSAGDTATWSDIMLEEGSSPSPYDQFKGDNVTIQLGQTLYGGKLTILQDGSADVDVTDAYLDAGTKTWTSDGVSGRGQFRANLSDALYDENQVTVVCSAYQGTKATHYSAVQNNTVCISNAQSQPFLRIRDDRYVSATGTEFQTAMSGVQVVYKLYTPFTLHLSPVENLTLLQGINNVWTDGTTLSLTYQPDNAIGQAKGTAQDAMAIANGLKPLYSTGSVGSGKTGTWKIAEITLPEAGIYYITGWARFTGNGKKAVWLWCEGSLSESWEDSTITAGEPKTFSTFAIYTASAAGKVVQVDSYTVSASNAVTGGIVAFKIA